MDTINLANLGLLDSVETDYDANGRPYKVSMPYIGTAGQAASSGTAFTTTTYDPLNRPTQITDGGNGTLSSTYSNNDVLQTLGPKPSGENSTKQRQFEYDGLGRLTSVCELTTQVSGWGTCSQTTNQNGLWTEYSFNVLNEITAVTQNAQSSTKETRAFSFDALGRLTQEVNPESNTTNYTFDSDSTCGTSNGDLVKRTDAVGTTTCYSHDALHRPTAITYSGGYASATPNKYFVYDSATVNNTAMANAKARLAEAYTGSSKTTDEGFSYDVLGRTVDFFESAPSSNGYYHVSASYWPNNALNTLSIPSVSTFPTITYTPDGEGRINQVTANSGQSPLVNSTTYPLENSQSPWTMIVQLGTTTAGVYDTDTYTLDQNTGRTTKYDFNVNGQHDTGTLTWNANGSLGSLNISDAFAAGDTQNCTYTHDDLARILSDSCTSWAQTFSTDAFGNAAKTSTSSSPFPATFNTNNQIASVNSFVPNYDANGNVKDNPVTGTRNTYAWDAEGRPVTVENVTQTFDALGRMVYNTQSPEQFLWSPWGTKLADMSGQSLGFAMIPLPAGAVAMYNPSTVSYYAHADWLGSWRLASTPGRAFYANLAYAPYGETYAGAGPDAFTGQIVDTPDNLNDFTFRLHAPAMARWSPPTQRGLRQ